jgi:ABC-type methionine transport system ATPase subunit
MLKFAVVLALVATSALAAPAQEQQQPSLVEQAYNIYSSCTAEQDVAVCLKLKALGFVDRAARSAEIDVIDGFKIVQNEEAKSNR